MLTAYMVLIDDKAMRSEFEAFYYDNRLRGMRVAYNILHSEALAEEALSEAFFNAAKCFQKIHDLPSHKQQAFFVILNIANDKDIFTQSFIKSVRIDLLYQTD